LRVQGQPGLYSGALPPKTKTKTKKERKKEINYLILFGQGTCMF
jgi:hypothetical protein